MQIRKRTNILIVLFLFVLFIFLCFRAALVDITHDEAYSFLNIKNFWHVQFLCNANSHWINSLGMKIGSLAGFENPLGVRWLSLVGAAALMIIGYQWIKEFQSKALQFFAFSFFFLNPFLLDYLMLARGYVHGLAFEVLALYFFVNHLRTGERRFGLFAVICAGLSAIGNFNFFYFLLCFCLIYFIRNYSRKGFSFLRMKQFYLDTFIALGFILLVLRALLFIRRCSNDFGFGGEDFIYAIWGSYVDGSMYLKLAPENPLIFYFALPCFALSLISTAYGILTHRLHKNDLFFYSSVITAIMLALILFNHFCFHVLYPNYRTCLPLFPLAVINLCCFFDCVFKDGLWKRITLYSGAAFFTLNFISSLNFKYTFDFYHQCEAKEAFTLIDRLGAEKVGISPEHYGVFINYYQATDDYKFGFYGERINTYDPRPTWEEKTRLEDFNYLVLYPPYNLSFYKNRPVEFDFISFYPITKTLVIRVKKTKN